MTFDIQFEEIHKNGEKDPQIKSPDLLMIKKNKKGKFDN